MRRLGRGRPALRIRSGSGSSRGSVVPPRPRVRFPVQIRVVPEAVGVDAAVPGGRCRRGTGRSLDERSILRSRSHIRCRHTVSASLEPFKPLPNGSPCKRLFKHPRHPPRFLPFPPSCTPFGLESPFLFLPLAQDNSERGCGDAIDDGRIERRCVRVESDRGGRAV